jgi:aminoglycoside/choline kinase family phosphotransferase
MSGDSQAVPEALVSWAITTLPATGSASPPALSVVAGDASNRRYFRLARGPDSHILVEAPPGTEKNEAFLAVRQRFEEAGVRVPALLGADLTRGYLLLEDLGDRLLQSELTASSVDARYRQALALARRIAAVDIGVADWPRYDTALLAEELERFSTWFVAGLLEVQPDTSGSALVQRFNAALIDAALEQPRVLVHRDFHSRNLMPLDAGELGVIDFQDAVLGPLTYDAVSLLRDCYIRWPVERVTGWALLFRDGLLADGLPAGDSEAQFLRWFDWMGLQRHIKVLGTFARLYLRDGKPGYLQDLPLVIRYVREILEKYGAQEPLFADFHDWFENNLGERIAARNWSGEL